MIRYRPTCKYFVKEAEANGVITLICAKQTNNVRTAHLEKKCRWYKKDETN